MTKAFGAVTALDGVDLVVRPGAVLALVGENGSGKSTLLRLSAGLSRPSAGIVEVFGARAGTRAARGRVAFVPDEPGGLDELTVREHLGLLRALAKAPEEAGLAAVEQLGLVGLLDVRVGALSRGQRRRAALAAALGAAPGLLLIDEATVALDAVATAAVERALRAHARSGGAVVLASHDLAFVARACDRVALLRAGRVVGTGAGTMAGTLAALASATAGHAPSGEGRAAVAR